MRLFIAKPGINALGQPLPVEFTVDNSWDTILVLALLGVLLIGVVVAVSFVIVSLNTAPKPRYITPAAYQSLYRPAAVQPAGMQPYVQPYAQPFVQPHAQPFGKPDPRAVNP